ncbi:MAG: phosphate ABC transporter substrate-binding protein PstS [Candidatus Margulisbacteria bacterium]|nr:phosphate ABC transporter substrate-binding protein PstS [Candidatus Margulisiibacteriota bacterium]
MIKKALGVICAGLLTASMASAVVINGAGATFPYPLYLKLNTEYQKATGKQINYQGIGSGGGIRQFTAGTTDFGGTDAAMTEKEIADAGGDVLHIPTVMGAVAVSYNLPGVKDIKLDAGVLADIFLGKIKNWDHSAIAALNPGVSFPNKPILVAHRSDGSGTTDIFTNYLARVSTSWAAKVGAGKAVKWPVGVGGKGNAGVAGVIKVNEGAIGYVELSYAMENGLSVALLKNRAGKFIRPTLDSTSAAAAGALEAEKTRKMVNSGDFRISLCNAPGKDSYPIVGLTWLIVHKNQKNAEKGKILKDYLRWVVTTGQKYAPELLYAPLPETVKNKVVSAIDGIKI